MSNQHIVLTNQILREVGGDRAQIVDILAWLDDHPEQVPGRTITESEVREGIEWAASRNFTVGGIVRECLRRAGHQVVPEPEPTNAEKLEVALTRLPWLGKDERRSIAEQLDWAGVRATEDQEK